MPSKNFIQISICLAFLLTSSLVTHSQSSKTKIPIREVASKHYHIANNAYDNGNVSKAIRHLNKALDLMPSHEKYINCLANIYHEQEEYRKALRLITQHRYAIQDAFPEKAIQLLNWEGCYALGCDLPKEAILRFEEGIAKMELYELSDSVLASHLYCNWGVAELFDQGIASPCDTRLIGGCHKIHLSDIHRANAKFQRAIDLHPLACNEQAIWNRGIMDQILLIPPEIIAEYKGYIPKDYFKDNLILPEKPPCAILPEEEKEDEATLELNLDAFTQLHDYDEILFVLDISYSMTSPVRSDMELSRFKLMKRLISEEIQKADSTHRIGMLTVGGSCGAEPAIAIPVDTAQQDKLLFSLDGLAPDGVTPLYSTLTKGPSFFSSDRKSSKVILLASDGIESCSTSQSVCQLAEELCSMGIRLEVFSLLLDERSHQNAFGLYQCIAEACESKVVAVQEEGLGTIEDVISNNFLSLTVNVKDLISGQFDPVPSVAF